MADLKASVLLSLKDGFSGGIKNAGAATKQFASTAMSAVDKVDKAFSGVTSKLGALGVSLSLGAASNQIIDLDARLTRMGMTADASAEQVNRLKRKIFEAAQDPNIKIGTPKIVEALESVMTKTGDWQYIEDNVRNVAVALQATGEQGESIGDMFADFQKGNYKVDEISHLMDVLVKQGDQGEYTMGKFAKTIKSVRSAYSLIGTSVEDTKKLGAVMQILISGTKNEEAAVTSLDAIMSELADPKKQEQLGIIGVRVRDTAGNFRDLADIMQDVLSVAEKEGNTDFLGEVFGMTSMKAIRAFQQYGKNYKKLTEDLGDTTGALEKKSARMAGTKKANLQNIQTTFLKFADKNLAKPLERLNDLLSYLAEKPERFEKVFNTIKYGLASIVAIKGLAKAANFVSSISGMLGKVTGGKTEIALAGGAASGMPVFVTNMGQGGMGAASGLSQTASGGAVGKPTLGGIMNTNARNFKSGALQAGVLQVVTTAVSKTLAAVDAVRDIDADESLSKKEKAKKKGGAIGDAVGTTVGTGLGVAAGAFAAGKIGAMIGTAIAPGVGTAIGGAIGMAGGALVGWIGGKLGKKAGEVIGGALSSEEVSKSAAVKEELDSVPKIPAMRPIATLEGKAGIDLHLSLTDERTFVSSSVRNNDAPFAFNTGRVVESRRAF